jgi:Flp pilus assembly protein TadG
MAGDSSVDDLARIGHAPQRPMNPGRKGGRTYQMVGSSLMSESSKRMSTSRGARRRLRNDRGSTLVEFALVLTALMMFLLGIMDFSRMLYTYHFVGEAAREGTRYAVVHGSTFTTGCSGTVSYSCSAKASDVQSYVQGLTPPGITSGSLSVNTTWPGTAPAGALTGCSTANGNNSPGCLVQVSVSYPFKFMFPFLPKSTCTLSSTSVMVIAQ